MTLFVERGTESRVGTCNIYLQAPKNIGVFRLDSSAGRALALQARGRRFESCSSHAKRISYIFICVSFRLNNLNKVVKSLSTIAQLVECLTSVDTGVSRQL